MAEKLNNPFKISELVETVNDLVDTTVDDSNLVHKTGDETINGIKSFKDTISVNNNGPALRLKNLQAVKGTTPSDALYWTVSCSDSTNAIGNSTKLGHFQTYISTAGNVITQISAYKPEANSTTASDLSIVYPVSGNPYATAPTPDTSDNSTKIATTAWVKNQGYMSSGNIFPNNTWVPVGDDAYIGDHNHGGSVCIKGNNNNSAIYLYRRDETASNGFYLDENDNNGLKILNPTQGAQAWWSVTAMIAESYGSNGYIKFNHGLIIQWGTDTNTSAQQKTVTLPTAFTSKNYSVVMTMHVNATGNSYSYADKVNTKTTTNFTYWANNTINWIAIGY